MAARVTDGHDLIRNTQIFGRTKFRSRQARRIDLYDRKVRHGIAADQLRFIRLTVGGYNLQGSRTLHNMRIRDDVAIFTHDDAGTFARRGNAAVRRIGLHKAVVLCHLIILDAHDRRCKLCGNVLIAHRGNRAVAARARIRVRVAVHHARDCERSIAARFGRLHIDDAVLNHHDECAKRRRRGDRTAKHNG